MSIDEAAGWGDPPPPDGDGAFGADPWDDIAHSPSDPIDANWFSDELENVNASDWDVDAASIWGDDATGAADIDDGGAAGLDFTL